MESNFYDSECEVMQVGYDEAKVYCSRLTALEVLKRGHAVPNILSGSTLRSEFRIVFRRHLLQHKNQKEIIGLAI